LSNIAKMLAVTIAPRRCKAEHALVDAVGLIEVAVFFRACLAATPCSCSLASPARTILIRPIFVTVLARQRRPLRRLEPIQRSRKLSCLYRMSGESK
jgi:hypothetical protein